MELPKYAEVLKEGKMLIDKLLVPIKASQARKSVEMQILSIEEKQAQLDIQIHEQFEKVPFNAEQVYTLHNQRGLLERQKDFYNSLLKDSF